MDLKDQNYQALFKRNWPIIPKDVQNKLKALRIAVAGCGSTGGAVVDGASRLGVQRFHLCDNGEYELNNLNRQFVFRPDLERNKASVHADRIKNLNSGAEVKVWDKGLTPENMDDFLEGIDFLFDAVDVTTKSGMAMKLLLHEKAAQRGIPTGSALDLAFVQWLQSYNYHQGDLPLHGRLEEARSASNPLKALIAGFSNVEELSVEISDEIIRLIENPEESACQLACVCFLLSAMMTPYLIEFVTQGRLPSLKKIDLMSFFETPQQQEDRRTKTRKSHESLKKAINKDRLVIKNFLFLHYGPGGNAQVEQQWIGPSNPHVLFWDQPDLPASETDFSHLAEASLEKALEIAGSGQVGLIGHSFGGELALSIAGLRPEKISKLILISPIRDLSQAFAHLALKLHSESPDPSLLLKSQKLQQSLNSGAPRAEQVSLTWEVINSVVAHPAFSKAYWASEQQFKKHQNIVAKTSPLNLRIWQSLINEQLLAPQKIDFRKLDSIPVKVILGEADPYYDIMKELAFWKERFGEERVSLIPNAGHFPHLETPGIELN